MIPLTSSEHRKYIPLSCFSSNYIPNNTCSIIENANMYHFGVLSSEMHMVWVRQICGRLEGRYRYSNNIVYNNFPWPDSPSKEKVETVRKIAFEILKMREEFKENSLTDLYDPLLMPKKLVRLHNKLDNAVDKCYRSQPFVSELNRLQFLFRLYRKYVPETVIKNLETYDNFNYEDLD